MQRQGRHSIVFDRSGSHQRQKWESIKKEEMIGPESNEMIEALISSDTRRYEVTWLHVAGCIQLLSKIRVGLKLSILSVHANRVRRETLGVSKALGGYAIHALEKLSMKVGRLSGGCVNFHCTVS